jgi:hypothetical protein
VARPEVFRVGRGCGSLRSGKERRLVCPSGKERTEGSPVRTEGLGGVCPLDLCCWNVFGKEVKGRWVACVWRGRCGLCLAKT